MLTSISSPSVITLARYHLYAAINVRMSQSHFQGESASFSAVIFLRVYNGQHAINCRGGRRNGDILEEGTAGKKTTMRFDRQQGNEGFKFPVFFFWGALRHHLCCRGKVVAPLFVACKSCGLFRAPYVSRLARGASDS